MLGTGYEVLGMARGTHGAAILGVSTGLWVYTPLWVSTDIPMAITCLMPVGIALGRFGLGMPSATKANPKNQLCSLSRPDAWAGFLRSSNRDLWTVRREGEDHGAIATRCSRLIAAVGPLAVGRLRPVARARGGTARLFRANDRRNMASAL